MQNNNKAMAPKEQPKPEVKQQEPPKVVAIAKPDPVEDKVKSIIQVGQTIRHRNRLNENLAVCNTLILEEGTKYKAQITITDSHGNAYDSENPMLVADIMEAVKASLQRQVNEANDSIKSFSC
jgi:hypothetical protein